MATIQQIEANRLNAQKSTGPRSVQGKAVSRFNATKTGIDAESQIIRGEDPDDLETLAAEYQERWRPAAPEQRLLVDILIHDEWLLRRFRRIDAEILECEMQDAWTLKEDCPAGQAFSRGANAFSRLQRRIDSTERSYHRALKELQRLESHRPQSDPPPAQASEASLAPDHRSPAPAPANEASPPGPASEASPPPPSEDRLGNEPNSGIASLTDAAASPAAPPPSSFTPFPHPLSPPQHPLAEQS